MGKRETTNVGRTVCDDLPEAIFMISGRNVLRGAAT